MTSVRVAVMVTCINDTLFPDTGKALVGLWRQCLGCDPRGRVLSWAWGPGNR